MTLSKTSERMRLCRRLKIKYLLAAVVTLILFFIIETRYVDRTESASNKIDVTRQNQLAGPPLSDGVCNSSLGATLTKDLEKINSYSFPQAQPYLKDLFPDVEEYTLPKYPTFVAAFDSSHYYEGTQLVENINTVVRKRYHNIKLVIYDLGLTRGQKSGLRVSCRCEIRDFPFDRFPKHMKLMKGYAWKPLAIQLIIKEHPFVMWMDTSVRFMQTDLDAVFDRARRQQVMAARGSGPIAERTSLRAFNFLGEEPCTFRNVNEFEATFIIIHADKFVMQHFLKPWVSCALSKECMVLGDDYANYLDCDNHGVQKYFVCHRFDQAILSVLLYRLFHSNIDEHKMDHTFFQFCKGRDNHWYLPQFIDKWLIDTHTSVKCF